jgi:hypothetical protein
MDIYIYQLLFFANIYIYINKKNFFLSIIYIQYNNLLKK